MAINMTVKIAVYSHSQHVWYWKDICRFTHTGPFFTWVEAVADARREHNMDRIVEVV